MDSNGSIFSANLPSNSKKNNIDEQKLKFEKNTYNTINEDISFI